MAFIFNFPDIRLYPWTGIKLNYPVWDFLWTRSNFRIKFLERTSVSETKLVTEYSNSLEFLMFMPVVSSSLGPHGLQPARLLCPWNSPGKNTGVGYHFLLQGMKVKSDSEVTQSCPTHSNPMDCSLPGSSIHGIFQARVLEWGAIAFSTREA